jgi:predicted nuclease of predicted toxin-antitoxin system
MKLLANENIPLTSVKYLSAAGCNIISIGLMCPGITDKEVMELAMREGRTIITFDRDYSELIYKYGYRPNEGVIYLRFDEYTPEFPGQLIYELINQKEIDFVYKLIVVDVRGIRQRKY